MQQRRLDRKVRPISQVGTVAGARSLRLLRECVAGRCVWQGNIRSIGFGCEFGLDSEQLARLVGFPNYETLENLKMVAALADKPPFTGQSNYEELKQFLVSRSGELETELGTLKHSFKSGAPY